MDLPTNHLDPSTTLGRADSSGRGGDVCAGNCDSLGLGDCGWGDGRHRVGGLGDGWGSCGHPCKCLASFDMRGSRRRGKPCSFELNLPAVTVTTDLTVTPLTMVEVDVVVVETVATVVTVMVEAGAVEVEVVVTKSAVLVSEIVIVSIHLHWR